jgi:hypothetical protein
MEYQIMIEEHAGQKMVHTYIKGALSSRDRDRIGTEAIKTMADNGLSLSIWDLREAEIQYSLTTVHMAISNVESTGLNNTMRVAVVYRQNKVEFEHAGTAAFNRGIHNLNYFEDFDEAIRWLASGR